jgi:hypothetical protein
VILFALTNTRGGYQPPDKHDTPRGVPPWHVPIIAFPPAQNKTHPSPAPAMPTCSTRSVEPIAGAGSILPADSTAT